jgi:hypothetical protein
MALRSVLKENGASSAKGFTRQDRQDSHPSSPDLTPRDFYLWGYVKDQVYQSPMPQTLREIRQQISQGIANVDDSQLRRAWEEFEYRVRIYRVSNGAHIEHL